MLKTAAPTKVIHRHSMRGRVFTKVSELTYVGEQPVVVLSWMHHGESRIPGVFVPLDSAKLKPGATRRLFNYSGVTIDPRYAED